MSCLVTREANHIQRFLSVALIYTCGESRMNENVVKVKKMLRPGLTENFQFALNVFNNNFSFSKHFSFDSKKKKKKVPPDEPPSTTDD